MDRTICFWRLFEFVSVSIFFVQSDIMRLRFNAGEALLEDSDKMVVESPKALDCFQVQEEENGFRLETAAVTVLVQKKPLAIGVQTPDGRILVKTKYASLGGGDQTKTVLRLALSEKEHIYGLGRLCWWRRY